MRDIKILPSKVIPTKEGLMLFGLIEAIYVLDYNNKIYSLQESSGIIRNGFTTEFYNNNQQFFTEWP